MPDEDDEKTRIIRRPGSQPPSMQEEDDDTSVTDRTDRSGGEDSDESGMTRLVGLPPRGSRSASQSAQTDESGGENDPVVGWLVIVAGPGRGNAARLGYGQNSIGRDRDERVRIDFGDSSISRKKHCFIIYEPRKRQFILRPGDSANLAYLNGELVSESSPLAAGNLIEVGQTTLRFVPLCGPDFEWQDLPAKPSAAS